jgi:hypothetical protein
MPIYRFIEGEELDEPKETWYRHDEDMSASNVKALLKETWAGMKTRLKPGAMVARGDLFLEAGFILVKPEATVHLGYAHWLDQMVPDWMDRLISSL